MNLATRLVIITALFFLAISTAYAQDGTDQVDSRIQSYIDAFNQLDNAGKLSVIQSSLEDPVDEVAELYKSALSYLVNNGDFVSTDNNLRNMAYLVIPLMKEVNDSALNQSIWDLFIVTEDNTLQMSILDVLAVTGPGDLQVGVDLSTWVQGQNGLKNSGVDIDEQVLLAAVEALGNLVDPEAFPVLLESILERHSNDISSSALRGLLQFQDTRVELFQTAIVRGTPEQKAEILSIVLNTTEISDDEKASISNFALGHAVDTRPSDLTARMELDKIRMAAVRQLADNVQSEHVENLIKHFNASVVSFDRGLADRSMVLEAIGVLGKSNNSEAAERLAAFLTLINTYTQEDRPYDRQITLAVIENLGLLAKVEAYNPLYMVTILSYPRSVKDAAVEALQAVSR